MKTNLNPFFPAFYAAVGWKIQMLAHKRGDQTSRNRIYIGKWNVYGMPCEGGWGTKRVQKYILAYLTCSYQEVNRVVISLNIYCNKHGFILTYRNYVSHFSVFCRKFWMKTMTCTSAWSWLTQFSRGSCAHLFLTVCSVWWCEISHRKK